MDCGSNYESSILSGHPIFVAGSVNGKPPAFEAGFRGSIPRPAATGRWRNGRRAALLNAEVPGSRPGRPAKVSRGHRPKDRTVRYERTNRGSTPRVRTKFSAGRPIAQDTALRTLKLGLESPLVDPVGPTMGVSSNWPGSLSFKQRMRDRDPPPLPSFGL